MRVPKCGRPLDLYIDVFATADRFLDSEERKIDKLQFEEIVKSLINALETESDTRISRGSTITAEEKSVSMMTCPHLFVLLLLLI